MYISEFCEKFNIDDEEHKFILNKCDTSDSYMECLLLITIYKELALQSIILRANNDLLEKLYTSDYNSDQYSKGGNLSI